MKNPKSMADCCIFTFAAFFLVPFLCITLFGVPFVVIAFALVLPVLCFVCGLRCGKQNGFSFHYPLFSGITSLIILFVFFRSYLWENSLIPLLMMYVCSSFFGVFIGYRLDQSSNGRHSLRR